MVYLVIIYGVHGDETMYTSYLANLIKRKVKILWPNENEEYVEIIGPYEEWNSTKGYHFSNDLTDPNRQHISKVDNLQNIDQDLYESFKIFQQSANYINGESKFFLTKCREKGINLKKLLTKPQMHIKDYFCYVNESSLKRHAQKRVAILKRIETISGKSSVSSVKVLDLHAGIGRFGKLNIIYKASKSRKDQSSGYLVDGLNCEYDNSKVKYYVIESGISSTLTFFDRLYVELINRGLRQIDNGENCLLDFEGFSKWKIEVDDEVKYIIKQLYH